MVWIASQGAIYSPVYADTVAPGADGLLPGQEAPAGGPTAAESDEQEPLGPDRVGVRADLVRVQDGVTLAEGSVELHGSDFDISADTAVIDAEGIWVHLEGHVVIGTETTRTSATSLRVNLETSKWRASHARTRVLPAFFGQEVAEPVFLRAQTIETPQDKDIIRAVNAWGTTCNKPRPHYALHSKRARVAPGSKVVFEDPSLYALGTRVIKYPFDLVLSLEQKENRFIPEFGENRIEGKYAKFAYLYLMDEYNSGLLRLHLTQERGTGFGLDHSLTARKHTGELSFFYEPDDGALTSRLSHRWKMSDEYDWSLRSNYQRNSGYYGTSKTLSNDWSLSRRSDVSDSSLAVRHSLSDSGSYSSRRFQSTFAHRQQVDARSSWDLRAAMREQKSREGEPADQELDTSFQYRSRQPKFDWNMVVDKRVDLDGSKYTRDDTYRALNRLPQITLNTDTDRLDAWRPLGRIATRATLQLARYEQDPEDVAVSRGALKLDFGGRSYRRLTGNCQIRSSARYYQSVYDEGSAQYLVGFNTEIRQELGANWTTRWRLDYSSPNGLSPIRVDYWGRSKDLQFQAARVSPNRSRIDLSTGYDMLTDKWRTALGRFEFMTSGSSKLSLQSAYDIENSQWRPLDARWQFAHPRKLYLSLGAQYDVDKGELTQGTAEVDWTVDKKTRVEFLGRYSGFTHRLDQIDVRLTRDMHCWVGGVSYSRPSGDWQINLGLKAFPSIQANFGSSRGASFQSGAGTYY